MVRSPALLLSCHALLEEVESGLSVSSFWHMGSTYLRTFSPACPFTPVVNPRDA